MTFSYNPSLARRRPRWMVGEQVGNVDVDVGVLDTVRLGVQLRPFVGACHMIVLFARDLCKIAFPLPGLKPGNGGVESAYKIVHERQEDGSRC